MFPTLRNAALTIIAFYFLIGCQRDGGLHDSQSELQLQIEAQIGSLNILKLPNSNDYQNIPQDPNNMLSQQKVVLGKFLFHETGIAQNPIQEIGQNTYSCASCHHSKAGFQSGMKQGIGEGGSGFGLHGEMRVISSAYEESQIDIQPIRSPTILNTAFQKVMLWNGQFGANGVNQNTEANWTANTPKENNNLGFEGLETQAIAGLDIHRLKIDLDFIINSPYKILFDDAFPNSPLEERYTKINAGLAIAAYERTILANEAPFQKWLNGDKGSMTETEVNGALLFFGKGNCYTCHSGPGLNGMEFHALGMDDLSGANVHGILDEATIKGRGGFTNNPDDDYAFKTPTLYNLKDVNHLGHGGNFSSVKEIIEYKNEGVAQNAIVPLAKLSSQFQPLGLTNEEINQLTAFIEIALYDPNLKRFVPESTPLNNCFPNADEQSKIDMGCD